MELQLSNMFSTLKNLLADDYGISINAKQDGYVFMVAAALQEELNEFYEMSTDFSDRQEVDGNAFKVSLKIGRQSVTILTYTPNQMGMPFNAAAIMKIHSMYTPLYTFFIGTCASLKPAEHSQGDVLIPFRVFSYESGKYENGKFLPDFMSYQTGDHLRKEVEVLKKKIGQSLSYGVIADEEFASGSAVINDSVKREEVLARSGRKVTGLDMEAYSIACMNFVLRRTGNEFLVIKGISDYAADKGASEKKGKKEIAKRNAADFTLKLILHLYKQNFDQKKTITVG
jgi:nucleoside phosphorylase